MGGGPKNVTSTTETNPSPYLTPGIQQAASAAQSQFAGNNPVFNQAQTAMGNRALQGSPVAGAANTQVQNTLQGDYLSPGSNPWLEGTFNRAADLTRGRLSSEFAGAGRDLGASAPARSEELQTLASNIYGGNYQQERNRQMGAVGQALPLANQDYTDINALLQSSNLGIDQLINRIGALAPAAGGTAYSSQPVYSTGLFG